MHLYIADWDLDWDIALAKLKPCLNSIFWLFFNEVFISFIHIFDQLLFISHLKIKKEVYVKKKNQIEESNVNYLKMNQTRSPTIKMHLYCRWTKTILNKSIRKMLSALKMIFLNFKMVRWKHGLEVINLKKG